MRYEPVITKGANGFSLIEVVAGLMILGIGLLAIASMQVTSIQSGNFSHHVAQATILAQDKLENLKNLWYRHPDLSSGQYHEDIILGTIFSRQVQIAEDAGNSMKTITVTVQWMDRGSHSISFSTIRSK